MDVNYLNCYNIFTFCFILYFNMANSTFKIRAPIVYLKVKITLYIYREFVWVFISFIVMFGLTIGERIIRMNAFN